MDYNVASLSPELIQYFASTPVSNPPPGVTSNFINPPTQDALQRWTTGVLLALAILLFLNRLYIKARLMRMWNWDDVSLSIGMTLACGEFAFKDYGLVIGMIGRHMWDVPMLRMMIPLAARYFYTALIIQPCTVLFVRATFFLLYIRLFEHVQPARIASWIGLGFVVVSHFSLVIVAFAIGNPREVLSWAIHVYNVSIVLGAVGLVADVAICVLPYFVIPTLTMSITKKVGACAIFLTGFSAIACSILNLHYRIQLKNSKDNLWDCIPANILSLVESLLGIMCACIPTLAFGFRQRGSIYQKVFLAFSCITSRTSRRRMSRLGPQKVEQRPKQPPFTSGSQTHISWVTSERNSIANQDSYASSSVVEKRPPYNTKLYELDNLRKPPQAKYGIYPHEQAP